MTRKNTFLMSGLGFKSNNLGRVLGMASKFYTNVAKGLKLKVRQFWGLTHTFAEVTEEKLVRGLFAHPSFILNRVNLITRRRNSVTFTLIFIAWPVKLCSLNLLVTISYLSLFNQIFTCFHVKYFTYTLSSSQGPWLHV